jgi:hypothetical protein
MGKNPSATEHDFMVMEDNFARDIEWVERYEKSTGNRI